MISRLYSLLEADFVNANQEIALVDYSGSAAALWGISGDAAITESLEDKTKDAITSLSTPVPGIGAVYSSGFNGNIYGIVHTLETLADQYGHVVLDAGSMLLEPIVFSDVLRVAGKVVVVTTADTTVMKATKAAIEATATASTFAADRLKRAGFTILNRSPLTEQVEQELTATVTRIPFAGHIRRSSGFAATLVAQKLAVAAIDDVREDAARAIQEIWELGSPRLTNATTAPAKAKRSLRGRRFRSKK